MIIGFNGKMGVGKSEAIKTLFSHLEGTARVVKFAQPLYDIQEAIYERISSVYVRPADFVKDRKLLQWIGTDWGRETVSQTLWVDLWKAEVVYNLERGHAVACDDVRFNNEAEVIRQMGGKIIQITSDRNHERIDTKAGINNHSSEAGIHYGYVDAVVTNNGSLEEFQASLLRTFKALGI